MGRRTRRRLSDVDEAEGTARRRRDPRVRSGPATPARPRGGEPMSAEATSGMDRVRIGIVGVGNIATLNIPGYLAHEQCDVVALCDPRADVLERRAREWGIDRTYADLDALLADPDIDAVEILGPTP